MEIVSKRYTLIDYITLPLKVEHITVICSEMETRSETEKHMNHAAVQAGPEMNSEVFPKGYDTMLSREFGGVDLSGDNGKRFQLPEVFIETMNS